ncbi:MAG: alkyl hydroperoxide reductase [Chthoniobacteraceae bacterium]
MFGTNRLLLAILSLPAALHSAESAHLLPLLDFSGTIHTLEQNDARRVRAFVFLSSECPVSQAGIPTLNRLAAEFAGVEFFGVWSDATVTRGEAARHFAEWKVAFPVLHDSARMLAGVLKPTHVPEAFVLGAEGRLVYRGAIDNSFEETGRRRAQVEKHFLADALRAALDGKPAPVAETKAVGCMFEAEPKAGVTSAVTFTRDIAPVVFARCMNCHREGQAAPFSLTNFAQTAKRAKQIARVTGERVMPPWMPSGDHEPFVGERWLSEREITLLRDWAAAGAPEGNPADLPPAPQFADGWRLGRPDLIVKMAEPFTVQAEGADILQNFVIPIPTTGDKLVAAIEFHPGNARVAHHAVLFLDDKGAGRKLDAATPEPGYENFGGPGFLPSGALGGWSVGNTARRLPGGMGRYLKKGSDLVVQMHYHPTGKLETDQSEIGIYFVDKPVAESLKEPAKLVGSIWLANYEMDIPAGVADYRRASSYTLPRDIIIVGVVPHMHLLGKTMTVTATRPDGTQQTLIEVPQWNYNWQDEYYYERPFKLPAGTRLDVGARFDNSDGNPGNPSRPPKRVTWGDGTLNEMLYCFFLITAEKTEDTIHTVFHNLEHDTKQPRANVGPSQ